MGGGPQAEFPLHGTATNKGVKRNLQKKLLTDLKLGAPEKQLEVVFKTLCDNRFLDYKGVVDRLFALRWAAKYDLVNYHLIRAGNRRNLLSCTCKTLSLLNA